MFSSLLGPLERLDGLSPVYVPPPSLPQMKAALGDRACLEEVEESRTLVWA